MLGTVFAMRHERKREGQSASLTELTAIHVLRSEIRRLREDAQRLRGQRDELLGVLTQLTKLLERWSEDSTKRPRR